MSTVLCFEEGRRGLLTHRSMVFPNSGAEYLGRHEKLESNLCSISKLIFFLKIQIHENPKL